MTRIVAFLVVILGIATGLHWLADRPGTILVEWQGYEAETSVFRAFVILMVAMGIAMLVWSALRWIWSSPAAVGQFLNRRRHARGASAQQSHHRCCRYPLHTLRYIRSADGRRATVD